MTEAAKSALRRQLLAARRAAGDDVHAAEAAALAEQLDRWPITDGPVCAYVPVGTEPGSLTMLDVLAAKGLEVLLPVVVTGADGAPAPLSWGPYRPGKLVAGRFGLREPAPPWLPATVLAEVPLVIVPATAVDRRGVRLGRGGGFYDRSLALRTPGTQLIAVVRDAEFVDELPAAPHDVPMTHALTPGRGVIALPTGDTASDRNYSTENGGSST